MPILKLIKSFSKNLFDKFGYRISLERKTSNNISNNQELPINQCNSPFSSLPFAGKGLQFLIENFQFKSVLDIGSGEGLHSDVLKEFGKTVTSIDFGKSVYFEKRQSNQIYIQADYYNYEFDEQFDAIWVSHVLEHQPNPNLFLKKIHNDLREGGILAITVPPLKHQIVGGHVTLWNAGLLLYQLVLAGFNCKEVFIRSYGYNISVILRKKTILEYPILSYDKGDIDKLSAFFPDGLSEPFDGDIKEWNWQ